MGRALHLVAVLALAGLGLAAAVHGAGVAQHDGAALVLQIGTGAFFYALTIAFGGWLLGMAPDAAVRAATAALAVLLRWAAAVAWTLLRPAGVFLLSLASKSVAPKAA